jgi:ribosomal-protein-alanine N-acetyltransferase
MAAFSFWPLRSLGWRLASRHRLPAVQLTSERLILRPLAVDDAGAMLAYASDPEVTRYLPWYPATQIDVIRTFLQDQEAQRLRGETLGLAMVLAKSQAMIGSISLMHLRSSEPGTAELGYLLARPYWGQGFMTEAARCVVHHAFTERRLTRLIAFADSENAASRRVLEKAGMQATTTELRIVKQESRIYVRFERHRDTHVPEPPG